jgi:putative ABC transport system substrate-binding protein
MRLPAVITGSLRSRRRPPLRRALLLCLALLTSTSAHPAHGADGASVLFVSSHSTTPYQQFIDAATRSFETGSAPTIASRTLAADQLSSQYRGDGSDAPDVIVALGTQAAEALRDWRPRVPVVYALIPRPTYNILHRSGQLICPAKRCTAVFIDQPMPRIFEVLAAAFDDRRRLGILFGPSSIEQKQTLVQLAANRGFSLHSAVVGTDEDMVPALDEVLGNSDVLLAVPDPVVYNQRTTKNILLTTYRYKVPVMAYSRAYAEAGAALSVYSTPQQIARQTTGIIKRYIANRNRGLPAPQYPRHYKIRINQHVAESLNLDFSNKAELQLIMKEADDE